MADRVFTLTTAARAAVLDSRNKGLQLSLTHMAIGDARYVPSPAQTVLRSERMRLVIGEGLVSDDRLQLDLVTAFSGVAEFWVREVGVYAGDLLAFVWSDPADTAFIAYKNAGVDFVLGVGLALPDLPAGSVTVVDSGQALGLKLGPTRAALAAMAAEISRLGLRDAQRMLQGR